MRYLQLASAALALTLTTLSTAPALAQAQPAPRFNDVTLRVATFPGTWAERVRSEVGAELAAQGIKLEFVPGTSAEFLAKLVAARGQPAPFDVVEIADENYNDFRAADFLKKLDLASIPNTRHLDKSLYDDYHIANWISQPAIVYNVDKFKEAGIAVPKRFTDLADPKLKGRVLVGDISVYISYYEVTALAYENGGSEAKPEAGFDALKKIAPHSATSAIATVAQLFQSGDIWAAIWPAHIAVRLADAGVNVSAVHPAVKGKRVALARGYVGVVSNSTQQQAAQVYINAILATKPQTRFYTESGLTSVNNEVLQEASKLAAKDKAGVPFLRQEPSDIANAWWPDYSVINKRDWARSFQRAIATQ